MEERIIFYKSSPKFNLFALLSKTQLPTFLIQLINSFVRTWLFTDNRKTTSFPWLGIEIWHTSCQSLQRKSLSHLVRLYGNPLHYTTYVGEATVPEFWDEWSDLFVIITLSSVRMVISVWVKSMGRIRLFWDKEVFICLNDCKNSHFCTVYNWKA